MGFINPLILYAMTFLAVPILILLLVNRRKIVLYWAAFKWMKEAYVQKRRRVKINDILKLLSKLLLIFFLVLLAARPARFLKGGGKKLVIVDNTASMATAVEGEKRLDIAAELAGRIVRNSDTDAALFSFDGRLNPISLSLLETLEVSAGSAGAKDLINALSETPMVEKYDSIYFISDFQKSFYSDSSANREVIQRLGKTKNLVYIPVDTRSGLVNVSLESYSIPQEGVYPGNENRINVKVKNYSGVPVDALPVTLSANGKKCDRTLVSLNPRESGTVSLSFASSGNREYDIEISIPPDSYAPDNSLKLVMAPGPSVNILSVVPESGESDFEFDVFFESALRSFLGGEYRNYRKIRPSETFNEDFANYDVIVLFGMRLSSAGTLARRLDKFLSLPGKGLAVFVPEDGSVSMDKWDLNSQETIETDSSPDAGRLADGLLGFMSDEELDPGIMKFFKSTTFKGGRGVLYLDGIEDPVASVSEVNGSPVLAAGFLPYPGYTNIFYNPNFVQFSQRLFWEVFNRRILFSYSGDEISQIRIDNPGYASVYALTNNSGFTEKLETRGKGSSFSLSCEPLMISDYLTLSEDRDPLFRFGYNISRADSDIESVSENEFGDAIKAGLHYDKNHEFAEIRSKREYFAIALILLLLALLFENYAHFWRGAST